MVSGGGSKSKAVSAPVFKYLPGQETLATDIVSKFQDILSGNMASPMAQTMQTVVGEAGMREAAQERRRIAETRGMSTPARQQAVGKAGEGAVSTMARVPQEMWQKAAEFLTTYSMQAPAVGQVGKESSKARQGGVCCYNFLAAGSRGELLEYVRRYKDSHYDIDSMVAQGYKRLALLLVPLMVCSKFFKWMIKWIMVHPMELYAKAFYEDKLFLKIILYPLTRVWVWLYALIGNFYGLREWHQYWKLGGKIKW